ncbi:hypothetical protein [Myxococcus sp. Y35]|uniref:hypothetical protein n=1 Tax=Pseudomyxococcus flavus TaxID=3115648 RepID=UPI003CF1D440
MKKFVLTAVAASSLVACTSVESAVVSGTEIASNGEAVAVVQAKALGLTAIFHIVDIVQSDLDTVINKLLIAEAKAMGASKVELLNASTTPRHGIYALTGTIIGFPGSTAVGVAVK